MSQNKRNILIRFNESFSERFKSKISGFDLIYDSNVFFKPLSSVQHKYFFEQYIKNEFRDLIVSLEKSTTLEHENNPQMKWAPLGVRFAWYSLLHYRQFYIRYETIIKDSSPAKITLSSSFDKHAVLALETVCKKYNISYEVFDESSFEMYSGPEPFYPAHDLYNFKFVTPKFILSFYRFFQSIESESRFYQSYWNLDQLKGKVVKQSWFFIFDRVLEFVKLKKIKPRLFFNERFYKKEDPRIINSLNWNGFTEEECGIINSCFVSFYKLNSIKFYNSLFCKLDYFFKNSSGNAEVIVNDCYNPFSRMLVYVFNKNSKNTAYLPHGITSEFWINQTSKLFTPKLIYTWNNSSRSRLVELNVITKNLVHPYIQSLYSNNKIKKIEKIKKVLILAQTSDNFNLDALEKSCTEPIETLLGLNVDTIHLKLHSSFEEVELIKLKTINKIKEKYKNIEIVNSDIRFLNICQNYDLIIIGGLTTAIYESSILGLPFIIYRGEKSVEALKRFDFPIAYNQTELKGLVLKLPNYNFEKLKNDLINDFSLVPIKDR